MVPAFEKLSFLTLVLPKSGQVLTLKISVLLVAAATVVAVPFNAHPAPHEADPVSGVITKYCITCHDSEVKKGGLDLDNLRLQDVSKHPDEWERVVRKLRARHMPPMGKPRPDERTYEVVTARLATSLDQAAAKHPNPGRIETLRRLNRTEYHNAIRDLLDLEIDSAALLPKDDASHGFDNVTVGNLSPSLLDRYISAAQKISRLAIGSPERAPGGETFRIRPDVTQEEHVEGLPLGTRGGALLRYTFARDGEYEVQLRLTRDRNEEIEGLREPHELEVLLDRARIKVFTVAPPKGHDYASVDANLKVRFSVSAGPHEVGVTFVKQPSELLETKRQPYNTHFNMHRHPRLRPAIYQISINGPWESNGPGDTSSRRQIFVCKPQKPEEQEACAERILSILMRRAYRRPVSAEDLKGPMEFYRGVYAENGVTNSAGNLAGGERQFAATREGAFDAGIQAALAAILISPEFLFRVEKDPRGIAPNTVYHIPDLALASRLSFFLWSSIPDDELLDTAIRGDLHRPKVLEKQARRMLADSRTRNLVTNFAEQWLYLRNLETITPDLRLFPDFDDNLRQAFREETERLFESVMREDRSVLDLLAVNYTFLNERLAKHYGIPNLYGSRFRRVSLDKSNERGGLLRQGGILTVTSYATRTSPVVRGNWILGNLLGTPPPPPPASVPALKENTISDSLPVRERLSAHRGNAACASCHSLMDPVGFSLENFDAIGRWRTSEDGQSIDVSGGLPDGRTFTGVSGLQAALRQHPELFVGTLAEKLLTFALGRGIEPCDAPAIREIVREAQANNFRFSSIILGIVNSTPFTMRKSE